uniref:Methyltransferase domain-containing protein n=1 Tax=Panagrolaimus davidi TaxID=227884 RepID=A0A914QRZ2_9BILA
MVAVSPSQNGVEFPAETYVTASKKWLGQSVIVYPSLLKVIGDRVNGKDIIDIGCGGGKFVQELIKLGANKIVGIDSNNEMVKSCRNNYNYTKDVIFREESSLDLSEESTYDFAFAIFVLHFNNNVAELRKSLINIARSLKPGGEFIAFVPNGVGDYNPTALLGKMLGMFFANLDFICGYFYRCNSCP